MLPFDRKGLPWQKWQNFNGPISSIAIAYTGFTIHKVSEVYLAVVDDCGTESNRRLPTPLQRELPQHQTTCIRTNKLTPKNANTKGSAVPELLGAKSEFSMTIARFNAMLSTQSNICRDCAPDPLKYGPHLTSILHRIHTNFRAMIPGFL